LINARIKRCARKTIAHQPRHQRRTLEGGDLKSCQRQEPRITKEPSGGVGNGSNPLAHATDEGQATKSLGRHRTQINARAGTGAIRRPAQFQNPEVLLDDQFTRISWRFPSHGRVLPRREG
jgi:hypothetical protein